MEYETNENVNSKLSLKIVVALSSILVSMDFLEIYFSFNHLKTAKIKYNQEIFENCIQYNILSQIVFTFFAALAGISAFILSIGLLFNSDYFAEKISRTYLYFNYVIFGPYLLSAAIFGMTYFNNIVFTCDHTLTFQKFNISNLMSLIACFLLSCGITLSYSFFYSIRFIFLSIRFKKGGFKALGKFFWYYVTRNNAETNNAELNNNEVVVENIEMYQNNITIHDLSAITPPQLILNENESHLEDNEAYEESREDENKLHSLESEYKNDNLCAIFHKIIHNQNTSEEAKKRAINALNLRKRLLANE
jgi:hypothetical protein